MKLVISIVANYIISAGYESSNFSIRSLNAGSRKTIDAIFTNY